MKSHETIHHKVDKDHSFCKFSQEKLKCNLCGEKLDCQSSYNKHISKKHISCDFCPALFAKFDTMKEHVRMCKNGHNSHENPGHDKIDCGSCNQSFSDKSGIKNHLKEASAFRTNLLPCKNCHERFKTTDELKVHSKEFHNCQSQRQFRRCQFNKG